MGNLRVWVDGQAGQCMGVHGDDDDDDDVVGGGGVETPNKDSPNDQVQAHQSSSPQPGI